MAGTIVKLAIPDIISTSCMFYQSYMAATMQEASSRGFLAPQLQQFDWGLFINAIINELTEHPNQNTGSVSAADLYLRSLGMDRTHAHRFSNRILRAFIDEIAMQFPHFSFENMWRCQIYLVEPCDIQIQIPADVPF